jgi:hypothetical protein
MNKPSDHQRAAMQPMTGLSFPFPFPRKVEPPREAQPNKVSRPSPPPKAVPRPHDRGH